MAKKTCADAAETTSIGHASECSTTLDTDNEVDVAAIRRQFPIFANHPDVVFFDNAATSQKPASVLRRLSQFYRRDCANAGRSSYRAATKAAGDIEKARKRVAALINAESADLVFTSGATESLNTVALAWGLANLKHGDEIMVCYGDHKSCVLPWLNLKALLARFGIEVKIVPIAIHTDGDYDRKDIAKSLSARTRLIAITHVHHLYGSDMEVAQVRESIGPDVLISLDASQSIGHRRVDVKDLPVDFLSFSGHKMFAGGGVGVLWVSPKVQDSLCTIKAGGMTPVYRHSEIVGGETLADKLECGTQNIASIISLIPAIDFIEKLGLEKIKRRVSRLCQKLRDELASIAGIEFAPGFSSYGCPVGFGIVSFRFEQIATSDLAFLLDSENIQVRTGDHCIAARHAGDDYVRVSLHVYNTEEEIERFLAVLKANLL